MRSLRFMHDNLVKTVTDELKAVRNVVEEVQLVVKQSSVSVAFVSYSKNVDCKLKLVCHAPLHFQWFI